MRSACLAPALLKCSLCHGSTHPSASRLEIFTVTLHCCTLTGIALHMCTVLSAPGVPAGVLPLILGVSFSFPGCCCYFENWKQVEPGDFEQARSCVSEQIGSSDLCATVSCLLSSCRQICYEHLDD